MQVGTFIGSFIITVVVLFLATQAYGDFRGWQLTRRRTMEDKVNPCFYIRVWQVAPLNWEYSLNWKIISETDLALYYNGYALTAERAYWKAMKKAHRVMDAM